MGWTETCAMDERKAFVREVLRGDDAMSAICERYGVSRKTGYKWLKRHEDGGLAGLSDRSRARHTQAHAIDPKMVRRIIEARRAHPSWGPKKLLVELQAWRPKWDWPALSTMGEILKRAGLVKSAPKRAMGKPVAYDPRPIIADEPNDLWTIDLKGSFRMADGKWSAPLTLADACSRYLLEARDLRPDELQIGYWTDRAFIRYGLPLAMRSDNGTPFAAPGLAGLSRLSVWWLKLGISLQRIRPGHPEHNPRHERFHRTLKAETRVCANARAQQRALEHFRQYFNHERPHESLGQRTPASVYRPSPRPFPRKPPQWNYGDGLLVLRVNGKGYVLWNRCPIYLSEAIRGEDVGFRQIDEQQWRVFLGTLAIATLHESPLKIHPYIEPKYHVRDAI